MMRPSQALDPHVEKAGRWYLWKSVVWIGVVAAVAVFVAIKR